MKSADMYIVCEDEGKIYNLCRRKGVRLQVIKDKEYNPMDEYIINSKYFVFENMIDNDLYKEYFREHILPYIMQVIPSTTILVLKGF